jgi:membrane-bound lytic murein transglycosylase B
LFRPQLIDAPRLLDLGWLERAELNGAWAGEIGQVQLLFSDYPAFGTDGDGDGHVHLKSSATDVIATAARCLRHLGGRPGEPWLEAVQVPLDLSWGYAGLYQRYPRVHWSRLGLRRADGATLLLLRLR